MAIATLNDMIAASTSGQLLDSTWRKESTSAEAAGQAHSLWRVGPQPPAGSDGAAGSGTPGAGGTAYDQAAGSLSLGWDDQVSFQKILTEFGCRASSASVLVLVDRLVSVSGVVLSSTGNKNLGTVALPRYTDGKGVRAWLEVTTATTTTAPVVTLNSYTDQDGNTGQSGTAVTFPAAATNLDTLVPINLASTDYGIQAAATINVGTAASAGAANFVLTKEIARLPLEATGGRNNILYLESMKFPVIEDGASLMLYFIASAAATATFDGYLAGLYG